MAKSCSIKDVNIAARATKRLLEAATKKIPKNSVCMVKLQTARIAFEEAQKTEGGVLERRNAFVRAAFHAGQAQACATVADIAPAPRKRKRRAAPLGHRRRGKPLGVKDEQGFDLAEVRRIANLINYGVPVEEIREKIPAMTDTEFFHAYKAAERYLKQDQDR